MLFNDLDKGTSPLTSGVFKVTGKCPHCSPNMIWYAYNGQVKAIVLLPLEPNTPRRANFKQT